MALSSSFPFQTLNSMKEEGGPSDVPAEPALGSPPSWGKHSQAPCFKSNQTAPRQAAGQSTGQLPGCEVSMAMTTQEALLRRAAWTTGMSSDGTMFPVGAGSPGSSGWLSCSPSPRWPGQVQEGAKVREDPL